MFFIEVEDLDPLLNTTFLFTQLNNDQVSLNFSVSTFSITARFPSPPFIATMRMKQPLFAKYVVDRNHESKISLRCFHNALLEAETVSSSSSMTIHLLQPLNRILLRFEPSRDLAPLLHHELAILPTDEEWSPSQLSINAKEISISSTIFKHIISAFSVHNKAKFLITSKGSQVKFSIFPFRDIILSQERGQCWINGDLEVETRLEITFNPVSFFRASFSKTKDSSCAIMSVPFQSYANFFICFPQM